MRHSLTNITQLDWHNETYLPPSSLLLPLNPKKKRRIYVDNRLHTLLDIKFDRPFFERGDFPDVIFDGPNPVPLKNPWINGTNVTPFDQGKSLNGYPFERTLIASRE